MGHPRSVSRRVSSQVTRITALYHGSWLWLETDHADVARFAERYLQAHLTAELPLDELPPGYMPWRVDCLRQADGRYRVRSRTGESLHDDLDCMAVVDMALRDWLADALMARDDVRVYHAAAVVIADRVWAIGGPSEVGKSTLALACYGQGWPVLSDEYTLCQATTAAATVEPFARAWEIRDTDVDALVARGASLCEAMGYPVRWSGGRVVPATYLVPRAGFSQRMDYPFAGWVLLDQGDPQLVQVGEEPIVDHGLRYPVYRLGRAAPRAMVDALGQLHQS